MMNWYREYQVSKHLIRLNKNAILLAELSEIYVIVLWILFYYWTKKHLKNTKH